MATAEAFLKAIRAEPDEDVHRFAYADWLTEQSDPAQQDRGEFIRVQCRLARLPEDDPARAPLEERESELLRRYGKIWTDRAFVAWLKHPKKKCRNPLGHRFCTLMAKGLGAECDLDDLSDEDPKRKRLERTVKQCGEKMDHEFDYTETTCTAGIFDEFEFRRGFIDGVLIQDWAVVVFAEALFELTLVRELWIEEVCDDDLNDELVDALVRSLDRSRLRLLSIDNTLQTVETVAKLVGSPALASLVELDLFLSEEYADAAVQAVADSPHLANLRSLDLNTCGGMTDDGLRALLDSPHLRRLTKLTIDEGQGFSPAMQRLYNARFSGTHS